MANDVTVAFRGDAGDLSKASDTVAKSLDGVGKAASQAGKATAGYTKHAALMEVKLHDTAGSIEQAGGTLSNFTELQNKGAEVSSAQARALLDIKQAAADAEQAERDLKQAQLDLNQSQIDAKQAQADASQSLIDQKQAALDARQAQEDYNAAVHEHGKNSIEAKQALIDLSQAQQDQKQAGIDATQAQADYNQAQEDGRQAQQDAQQATLDSESAMHDLAEAQRDAAAQGSLFGQWSSRIETAALTATGLVGTLELLKGTTELLSLAKAKDTVVTVASTAARVALTTATAIATAAQWAWNAAIAFATSPITLVVAAAALLVGGIVYLATKTQFFQTVWRASWAAVKVAFVATRNAVGAGIDWIVGRVTGLGHRISSAAHGMWDGVKNAFRSSLNWVIDHWNRLRFGIPRIDTHIPGIGVIGGGSFGVPRIARFHDGGQVPGAPGQEVLAVLQAGETVNPVGGGSGGGAVSARASFPQGGSALERLMAEFFHEAVRRGLIQLSVRGGRVAVGSV